MVENAPQSQPNRSPASETGNAEHLVLVVPQEPIDDSQIRLVEQWRILWQGKWLIVASAATGLGARFEAQRFCQYA